ncbi:MAG: Ig-like domain-containing protein, partial [Halobacteria archaeon]
MRSTLNDENALTVTVELLLTFSISAVLISLIALSFQNILTSTSDIAMYRELNTIGSDIASKIQDFHAIINTASIAGEITELTSQVEIPSKAGGSFYTIAIERGVVKLIPEINRNLEVKVPISPLIAVANCSVSSAEKAKILKFNRTTGTITLGEACDAPLDISPPVISFMAPSPANGSAISQTVKLKVDAVDNVQVAKVEYYLNDTLVYTAEYPYEWEWNTERYPTGEYRVKAIAYDRTGNTASDLMVYTVVGLPPGVVSDLNAVALTYPEVLLNWTKPALGSVASYKIYRNIEPINDSNLGTATLLANSWFDSPASYLDSSAKTQGMTYYYAVTAVNSSGVEGSLSNVVNVTIPITGTWNSSDLEPASYTPIPSALEKIYSFTPIFPNGTHGIEVDIAINISHFEKNGNEDNLHIEVLGLISDKSITLNGAKTYW